MESLLCFSLLLLGSVGLFVAFAFTDSNAVFDSFKPKSVIQKEGGEHNPNDD